jgi:hypothetical protein
VKVDRAPGAIDALQGKTRVSILFRPDAEIDVTVWPQSCPGIQPCRRPALYQYRLHARDSESGDDLSDFAFIERGLDSVETKGIVQVAGGHGFLQG